MRIWKFHVPITLTSGIQMPVGATILHVREQNNRVCLWACVDPEAPTEWRKLVIAGTGHEMPDNAGRYLGTALLDGGAFVIHVFEAK